ncbi:hypothetical protein [Mycolicibacterium mageritense]|uniref:hypothetical protein n=1 Tax=Mycolicibacterium mageritense TaxID=53462 RepID=UPI001E5FCECF|nr:hypothetical protein [Mycolicibacterium mageritense]GJJ17337.1 hypothetical protein MTY414_10100 [Mycolicibacterium mageritense]
MSTHDGGQPAAPADLYRVAAFLRELDRMLHPAAARPCTCYRLPPAVLPPLPPTGSRGSDPVARQSSSGWMATRTAPEVVAPLAAPEVEWVERAELPIPAPARAPNSAQATAPPPVPPARGPAVSAGPVESAISPAPPPAGPDTARATATHHRGPAPELRIAGATTEVRAPMAPGPPVPRLPTEPAIAPATPPPAPVVVAVPVEPAPPAPPTAATLLPPRASTAPQLPTPRPTPRLEPPPAQDLAPCPVSARAEPASTAPRAAAAPAEPVDLVIDGVEGGDGATEFSPTPEVVAETPAAGETFIAVDQPGPPPLPGVRGPRRALARLPAATASAMQSELQRRYLDRTLRRSR